MLTRYLVLLYLKYFSLIFIALVFFFVGLDYIQNAKSLPNSANLQILYVVYKSFYAIDVLLPIATVFGMLATKIYLIRSNELVAIYSIGYDKKRVIKPFFWASFFIITLFMALHTTSFAYANENADNIRKHSLSASSTSNLFFKYFDYYIYFKRLYPFQKKAEDVRIFKLDNGKLKELIKARSAYFEDNRWKIKKADLVENRYNGEKKITIYKNKNIDLLEGFKPKILDSVYEGKTSFSIIDAFYAIKLLKEQDVNIQKIKAVLFAQMIYPFFAPFLMVIIFYFVPITQRLSSITFFSFTAIISSLIVWGLLFTLVRLSFAAVLAPEITTLAPIAILALIALLFYKKF